MLYMYIKHSALLYCQCVVLLVVVNDVFQRYILVVKYLFLNFSHLATQIFMIYKKPMSARWATLGNTIVDIKKEEKNP